MNVTEKRDRKLDDKEVRIVRELIRNPRSSDNEISRRTGIPVMTVNRKRKSLENEMFLRYYVSIDKGEFGLNIFGAKRLYLIKFKIGITREAYMNALEDDPHWRMMNSRYISLAYLGEKDGNLALAIVLDARNPAGLVEEFNGKIVPYLRDKLGPECVEEVTTANLDKMVRVHHNYLPAMNMRNGAIKKEWPDSMIFVNEVE